jgi:hypothetical protein
MSTLLFIFKTLLYGWVTALRHTLPHTRLPIPARLTGYYGR